MILDASVASHWFVDTEFSIAAAPFRLRADLVAPAFLLLETANVLYKRSRAGDIAPEACLPSLELLGELVDLKPDAELLPPAVDLALTHRHPVYDCLYLALALQRTEPLATADRRLAALAEDLSIPTELIEPAT